MNFDNINNLGHETLNHINDVNHCVFSNLLNNVSPIINTINREFNHNQNTSSNQAQNNHYANALVRENSSSLKIILFIPGVEKKDVKINLSNTELKIEGLCKFNEEFSEFNNVNYKRIFKIPKNIKKDNITFNFNNGILKININKNIETADSVNITLD